MASLAAICRRPWAHLRSLLLRLTAPATAGQLTKELLDGGECRLVVDIGCGDESVLTPFRPAIVTVGIDASATSLANARAIGLHDHLIQANVLEDDLEQLLASFPGKVDLVTLYGVIEHLPKAKGLELLERCEALSSKYVILETPNGFVPQGPEFGNPYQRHLSGWFPHDFEGLGYTVYGTTGTRLLRGYFALPKVRFPGWEILDRLLYRGLRARRRPGVAFNLFAVKDVRGVAARLVKDERGAVAYAKTAD